MKLFGWKAGREGARPVLARVGVAGVSSLGAWPPSYEAQVRSGYAANPVVQRAVRLVAEGVVDAPVAASDPALGGLVAGRSMGQPLLASVATHLLLHGNAYAQILRDADGGVAELYALRPERVSVEADAGGWPVAYRYRVGERVTRLAVDEPQPDVVHIKGLNPLDDHYGLGGLAAAGGAIAIHNAATRWNQALLDNAARPSGALVYDGGDGAALSPEQFDRLKAEMEAGFAGAANAGRPMLLEGGLKWQAMSLTPADMDFVGLKAAAAREIALAFGVPPMLLGLPGDAAYANYREANRALWRLAILPLAGEILTSIAQGLRGWWPDAALWVDLNKVGPLAEERERLWSQVSAADFLSDEEKRAMLGLEARGMNGHVLAQLFAQGREEGADLATLRAIAEEAGELGARRALTGLGLSDEAASADLRELRELIKAWRDAKQSAVKAAIGWVVRLVLATLVVGIAVKAGFGAWLR